MFNPVKVRSYMAFELFFDQFRGKYPVMKLDLKNWISRERMEMCGKDLCRVILQTEMMWMKILLSLVQRKTQDRYMRNTCPEKRRK